MSATETLTDTSVPLITWVVLFLLLFVVVLRLLHYFPLFYVRRHDRHDTRAQTRALHERENADKTRSEKVRVVAEELRQEDAETDPSQKHILFTAQKIGHRGCRLDGLPENSLASFKYALQQEMDVLELDVWLTQDGEVVVFHDKTLFRMTGASREIAEMEYKDLPPLLRSVPGQCERIQEALEKKEFTEDEITRIPRLSEIIDLLPADKSCNIEVKMDSWELIKKIHDMVTERNKKHQIFWFSLEEKINKKLKQVDSKIPSIVSVQGVLKVLAIYYLGLTPFLEFEHQVFGITLERITLEKIRNERAVANIPDIFKRILAFILQGHPPYIMLCPMLFAHFRRRGIAVWFLNVQDEQELDIAIKCGATGVLTDRVKWLNDTMKAKNLSFKRLYE